MRNKSGATTRRDVVRLIAGGGLTSMAALLTGCAGQTTFNGGGPSTNAGTQPIEGTLGSGDIKVGLLLPLSATGNAGKTAQAMRNAAELALSEINGQAITLIPLDTQGTAAGAQAAAQQVLQAGAQIVLGPLFSSSVRAIAPTLQQANVPMIAYSTDTSVAGPGVYLLSFLPRTDIQRIVAYASRSGRRSYAALLPKGAYGSVVEGAARESIARAGGQLKAVEYYEPDQLKMQEPVQRIGAVAGGNNPSVDALIMPDGARGLQALSQYLKVYNISQEKVAFLGSGQWDDPLVRGIPDMAGGFYAAPDPKGYDAMSSRYQTRFGSQPARLASLAYDSVTLVAALAAHGKGFSTQVLASPDGFDGIDGIFRFLSNGTNDRGLAVMQVATGAPQIVAPAARSFAGF